MKVLYLIDGVLKEVGSIRLHENKVSIDLGEHNPRIFSSVFWNDKEYTPADGIKYMQVLVEKFSMSTAIVLTKESVDTWLEDK